jgi:hypothetical protein
MLLRWQSETRYYAVWLHVDMLGDWVLTRTWGGRFNRLGYIETQPVGTFDNGLAAIELVKKERAAHRYDLVSQTALPPSVPASVRRPRLTRGRRRSREYPAGFQ